MERDVHGTTPLHAAAKKGDAQLIRTLLATHPHEINAQSNVGATPLVYAAQSNHPLCVKALLDAKADPALQTRKGKTALMVATEKKHADVVQLLQFAHTAAAAGGSWHGVGGALAPTETVSSPAPPTAFAPPPVAATLGVAAPFGSPPSAKAAAAPAASGGFGAASAVQTPPPSGAFGSGGFDSLSMGLGGAAAPATAPPVVAASDDAVFCAPLPSPPADSVSALACSASAEHLNKVLAASSWDCTVRVWKLEPDASAATATLALTYDHSRPALSVALAADGARVFSGGADGAVRTVDLRAAAPALALVGEHEAPVSAVCTSAEQPHLVVSASWSAHVAVWDTRVASGAPPFWTAMGTKVLALSLMWPTALVGVATPAGVSQLDLRCATREPPTPAVASSLDSQLLPAVTRRPPRSLALHPRSGAFCVGTYDGCVGVHYPSLGGGSGGAAATNFELACHRSAAVHALAFRPGHEHLLATGGGDGCALLYDVHKRCKVAQLADEGLPVTAIAFAGATGNAFAFARSDDWAAGVPRPADAKPSIHVRPTSPI